MPAEAHGTSTPGFSSLSRRTVVSGALGVTALLAASRTATAQEATPESSASWLFLQACESGVATVIDGAAQTYELILAHASEQTLFFSDRPNRVAGIAPTTAVLDAIETVADDPPNAALAFSPEGSSDVVDVAVVTLTAPSFDAGAGTIAYRARVIAVEDARDGDGAEGEKIEPVTELPASFGQATLFIDGLVSHIFTLHPTYYIYGN